MNIDCNTAKNFKKQLSSNSLSITVRDMVLQHLYVCKECREFYRNYYMSIGKKFHIYHEMFKLLIEIETGHTKIKSKVRDIINDNSILKERYLDYRNNKWTNYAKQADVPKLSNLVAFKEIMDMEISITEENQDKIVESLYKYGLYEAEKIAKKVDMLERCLILEHIGDK